jgi:hypothetical protein
MKNFSISTMITASAFSVLAVSPASAQAVGACNTAACSGKVETILSQFHGDIWVYTDTDTTGMQCGASESDLTNKRIVLDDADSGQQVMYAVILSAKAQDKNLKFRTKTNTDPCILQYVQTVD